MLRSLRALWSTGNGWFLLTISTGWLVSLGIRIVYPVLLPNIMGEFEIRFTGAGFLLSVLWISYAAMQFPGGVLADRIGERQVLLVSLVGATSAVAFILIAPAFSVFVGATVLLGAGTGLYGPSRVTVLSDVFPDLRNTAVSFSQAIGNAGNAVLPIAAGVVSVSLGWRYGFGYFLPAFVLVIIGTIRYVPQRTSAAPGNTSGRAYIRDLKQTLNNPTVLYAAAIMFCILFYYQGITGFLPTYLLDIKRLSQPVVSVVYGGFFATAIAFQFLGGLVADRYDERRAIAVFVLLGVVGAIALPFAESDWVVITVVLLSASILGAIPPANTNIVLQLPESLQGSGYGLLRSLYIGLGASAPPLVGYFGDSGAFDAGILMLGVIALCSVVGCYKQGRLASSPPKDGNMRP